MKRQVVIALACCASVAAADPAAEKLFQDGRTALAAGKLDDACDAFARSNAIEPRTGTLLNLADCNERRGKIATAWNEFVEADTRATRDNDPREAEAKRRRDALAPRLPYLTVVVPANVRALGGVTMHRDGVVVDAAEWDRKLPIDPGTYHLTVDAAGYHAWQHDVTIAEAKEERVEVGELVVDPYAKRDEQPSAGWKRATITNRIGVGIMTGVTSDSDWINGARIVLEAAPVGPGIVRVVPQFLYAAGPNSADPYQYFKTYAYGLGVEYEVAATDTIILAGGLGVGFDRFYDSYQNGPATNPWGSLRLSPTFRYWRFDIGAHLQLVRTGGRTVELAELGLDYFVW